MLLALASRQLDHSNCFCCCVTLGCRGLLQLCSLLLFCGQLHIPGQAHGVESTDDPPGEVELPRLKAMAGRVGEGVVVVVPTLACRAVQCSANRGNKRLVVVTSSLFTE